MDIFGLLNAQKKQETEAKQNAASQKQKNKMRLIPNIVLIIANVLVLSLDYRVVEAVYKITNNTALAVFAIFTSGAMFILWFDVCFQYLLSNDAQRNLSLACSGLALISAGVFAFLDYGISVDIGRGFVLSVQTNWLFAGMVILTVVNAVCLFWWYIIDDQVKRESTAAREQARNDHNSKTVEKAENILKQTGQVLALRQGLEKQFGADAVNSVLNSLMGIEVAFGVDINGDGKIGASVPMNANAADVQSVPTLADVNPTNANSQPKKQ